MGPLKIEELLELPPYPFPFNPDAKDYYYVNEDGEVAGEPYSYNDLLARLKAISGVNEELMGPADVIDP